MASYDKWLLVELKKLCVQKGIGPFKTREEIVSRLLEMGEDENDNQLPEQQTGVIDKAPGVVENNGSPGDGVAGGSAGNHGIGGGLPAFGTTLNDTHDRSRHASDTSRHSIAATGLDHESLRLQIELAKIDAENRKYTAELERDRMAHELRIRELELRAGTRSERIDNPVGTPASPDITKLISKFDEKTGQIDIYLQTFEKICRLHNCPENEWCFKLPPLLPQGKSFEVYSRLSEQDSRNYEVIKKALLAAYRITPEQYRLRFRNVRKEDTETYREMGSRVQEAAMSWLKSKEASTAEQIMREFELEQFFRHLPIELIVWLNDKNPKDVQDAARLADEYIANRPQSNRNGRPTENKHANKNNHRQRQDFRPRENKDFRPPVDNQEQVAPSSSEANSSQKRSRFSAEGRTRDKRKCFHCQREGHIAAQCFLKQNNQSQDARAQPRTLNRVGLGEPQKCSVMDFRTKVLIDGNEAVAIRDSGADISLVHSKCINPENFTGKVIYARQPLDPEVKSVPLAKVAITIDDETVIREVGVSPYLVGFDMLLGNDVTVSPVDGKEVKISQVITRAQAKSKQTPLQPADGQPRVISGPEFASIEEITPPGPLPPGLSEVSPQEFAELQKQDVSLKPYFERLSKERSSSGELIFQENGLLFRDWKNPRVKESVSQIQLIVPTKFRVRLLSIAHEIPCAGHVGIARVRHKLLRLFHWPAIASDILNFVTSCVFCQRAGKAQKPAKAPLVTVPVVGEPFYKIVFDTMGPLPVTEESKFKYILILVDFGTRYPEVVPLPDIHAETVADALFSMFARLGFPKEVQHDKALSFCNELMVELWKRTGVKDIRSSAYHPESNSVVERMNRTVKESLRTLIAAHKKDWHVYLPHLLFAIRESPCKTTGFSPFELMYGRRVRGPLDLLREAWDGNNSGPNDMNTVAYVLEMRERLARMHEFAKENAEAQQVVQKTWFDKKARSRSFKVGQKVLLFRPCRKNKLQCSWQGPYEIIQRLNDVDYVLDMNPRKKDYRVYHINLMKEFVERATHLLCYVNIPEIVDIRLPRDTINPKLTAMEVVHKQIDQTDLSDFKKQGLRDLVSEFPTLFSYVPGQTHLVEHHIEVTDPTPVCKPPYRANPRVKAIIREELDYLLEHGIIRPSDSDYRSPLIIVEKEGKAPRACIDFRILNSRTKSLAYPAKHAGDLVDKISKFKYISTFDLIKGYHQIPLSPQSCSKTAFASCFGLFEYVKLPFGLKTGCGVFQRLMNLLLEGAEEHADSYLDDLAVFSQSWEAHLQDLRDIFTRVSNAGLTIHPDKTQWARGTVEYLGFSIGSGKCKPTDAKVQVLKRYPVPQTKKQIKAYLGLTGYYSKYIPSYADIVVPLTDMLRKKEPEPIVWSEAAQKAFDRLNDLLCSSPVLASPDFNKNFVVQCDASNRAIAAVLSQYDDDGNEHPVAFISRKLSPSEQAWSTIELELLSIMFAVNKFKYYLFGTHFQVVTDHNPLRYLSRMANQNARLMRWSLVLDQLDFEIIHRKGCENQNADSLSRIELDLF